MIMSGRKINSIIDAYAEDKRTNDLNKVGASIEDHIART